MKNKNEVKIALYNNSKIVIENYNQLIDIDNNQVIIDKYIITGSELKIKEMNEYCIVIIGIIKNIYLENDNK